MQKKLPTKLSEALELAAELARKNEILEEQLTSLLTSQAPEVLRPSDIQQLFDLSESKVKQWFQDPTFPFLNRGRRRGEAIMVLKSDLYDWLKTRHLELEMNRNLKGDEKRYAATAIHS